LFSAAASLSYHEHAVELLQELVKEGATPVPLPPSLPHHHHVIAPAAAAVHWALAEQRDALGDISACAAAAAAAATAAMSLSPSTTGSTEGDKKKKKPKYFKELSLTLLKSQESCTARAALLKSHTAQAAAAAAAVIAAAPVILSSSSSASSRALEIERLHVALSSPASASPATASRRCVIDFAALFHSSFIQSFVRSIILHRATLPLSAHIMSLSLVRIMASPPPAAPPCSMGLPLEFSDVHQTLLDIFADEHEHPSIRLEAALSFKPLMDTCGKHALWMYAVPEITTHVIESTALSSQWSASSSSPPSLPPDVSDALAAAAADLIRLFFAVPVASTMGAHVKVIPELQ
jgi:hypothetical protein